MKRNYLVALLIAPLALVPHADAVPGKDDKKELPNGPPSKAVTTDIVDAIAEEMNRSLTSLHIEKNPKPSVISYKITEVDVNDVAASLGQTTSKRNRHFVNIEARVRVEYNGVDNSNFAVPNGEEIDGVAALNLPLEATPRIARRAAWLVTDAAYKEALLQLRVKVDARRAGGGRSGDVPGWTAAKAVVSEDPVLVPELEKLDELEARAKALSANFRDLGHIRDSRVAVTSYLERRWYLTTEGTSVTDTRRASGVVIAATGQASDGAPLSQYFLRYGRTVRDLPTDKELTDETKKIAETIDALGKAPVMER
ncbi:MAG: hypothetical protein ACKV2T_29685, partial [Kofleriaceae bacterium]